MGGKEAAMKTPKTYRLSDKSLKQMEWLSARLDLTATDVLERAVADLFEREREKIRARLIPLDGGLYEFRVDDLPVAVVEQKAVDRMGEYARQLMSEEGAPENTLGVLVLCAAVEHAHLEIHQDNLERVYSGLVSAFDQDLLRASSHS